MLKRNFLHFPLLLSLFIPTGHLHSVMDYSSKSLSLKDYYEMKTLIQNRIKKSKESLSPEDPTVGVDEVVENLKKALKLVLMNPKQRSSLILMLQNEIMNYRSFDVTFRELVEEAAAAFKSSDKNTAHQISMLYLLENSMVYLKNNNNPESTRALKKIANGKLKISQEMVNYLALEMGRAKPISPSYVAKVILKDRKIEKRAEELRKKAFEKKQKKQLDKKLTTVKEKEAYRERASEKEAYRERASKKEKDQSFIQSMKDWFFPKESEPEENLMENKEEEAEVIKIEL